MRIIVVVGESGWVIFTAGAGVVPRVGVGAARLVCVVAGRVGGGF